MGFFKKINRGFALTLVILSVVIVYVCVLGLHHHVLNKKSAAFVASFFEADGDWRSIPEEFRQDSNAYIKSIEEDVRKYFDNENVYKYYINNAILSQYEENNFLEEDECEYKTFETYGSKYDGELFVINVYAEFGAESHDLYLTLRESDAELKIVSFAQPYGDEFSIE